MNSISNIYRIIFWGELITENWNIHLNYDPLPHLITSPNKAIAYFSQRDLLEEDVESLETLWELPSVAYLLRKQQEDGAWKYPGGKLEIRSQQNYNQLETYRIVGGLIEKYGLTRSHPAIIKATDFLFRFQTSEGDFRGIYGTQYTPNYTAAILELLIKAGYTNNPRLEKGFEWLLSCRQSDGGWAIPLRTVGAKLDQSTLNSKTIKPDILKPSSHLVTGCVLRAFAAHPKLRSRKEVKIAGKLLASRLFKRDKYPDRQDASFWTKFSYPFWFTDLLSALDSLSFLGFTPNNTHIKNGLDWFIAKQDETGGWTLSLLRVRDKDLPLWIALAICRVFKRFYG
ncbi:MAG: prenyltransferase/squalene oxidase repeat-containing protein [Candidatus Heimdallarchaeota archaeon]